MPQPLLRAKRSDDSSHKHARRDGPRPDSSLNADEIARLVPLHRLQRQVGNRVVSRGLKSRSAYSAAGVGTLIHRHDGPSIASPAGSRFGRKAKTPTEKKRSEIDAILKKSKAGKEALAILKKYKVPVNLDHPGPGSVYQGPAPGQIMIENTVDAGEAAFILVHEAIHAKASNEGGTADVMAMGRVEYVTTMINEETTATVSSIEAKLGMSKRAQKKVEATPVMQERYEAAYKTAYDAAIEGKKKKKEARKLAEQAGWQSVNDAFYDGSLVTSNTGETYGDYYGSFWDQCHAPPAEEGI